MSYKLYTIGQKGDNFYLDFKKAKYELERRKAIGDKDCILQELEFLSSFEGKNSVIITSYSIDKISFTHGYVIEKSKCYGCDVDDYNDVEWLSSNDQFTMVNNWYLGFEQMYPELYGAETNKILDDLAKKANEWIKFLLGYGFYNSLEEGINKIGLKQPLDSIVRLGYAESCYITGNIEEGDKYLQRVDLTLSHIFNERIDIYFKEVLEIRNKKVKNNKAIILTRFK